MIILLSKGKDEHTERGIIVCRINFDLTSKEFYENIKNIIILLKKIHSNEKHKY